MMTAEEFVTDYEMALASQQWNRVAPLLHSEVCVTFSNGSVHKGLEAVRQAYEKNFSLIENEEYKMQELFWVMKNDQTAVYTFSFRWKGLIQGQPASGRGRGTAVLLRHGDGWKLLAEHLGPDVQV